MDWWWYVLIAIVIVAAVVLLLRGRNPGVPGSGTADPPRDTRDEFSTDRPGAMDADDREDDDAYMRDRKIRERDQPPPPPAG